MTEPIAPGLIEIRKHRGLQSDIARLCKIKRQSVYEWTQVPKRFRKRIAKLTGISEKLLIAPQRTWRQRITEPTQFPVRP